jgi:DNA uptake protein ComE-like DNA-binding protein
VVAAVLGCLTPLAWGAQAGAPGQPAQPQAKPQTIGEKIAASKGLLDINTATAAELNALPGMGGVYAQRVIAGRPYSAKNQLVQRGILPEDEYLKIKDLIIAHRVKK